MEEKQLENNKEGFKKLRVKLVGTDGNAFSILGRVRNALLKAGYEEQARTFLQEATQGTYDNLLQTALKYVDVY